MRFLRFLPIMMVGYVLLCSKIIFARDSKSALVEDSHLENVFGRTPRARQVISRAQIEWQADRLLEQGLYQKAIEKCQEALSEKYINKPSDKNAALSGIVNAKQMLGLYDEAYDFNEEKIKTGSGRWEWSLRSQELLALIEFKKTNDGRSVADFISKRQEIMKNHFNVRRIELDEKWNFEKSLYLYEIIGDYDSALKLCDGYLAMKKVKKDEKFKAEVEDLRKTIFEAKQTHQKGIIFKKLNQYRFYNWL